MIKSFISLAIVLTILIQHAVSAEKFEGLTFYKEAPVIKPPAGKACVVIVSQRTAVPGNNTTRFFVGRKAAAEFPEGCATSLVVEPGNCRIVAIYDDDNDESAVVDLSVGADSIAYVLYTQQQSGLATNRQLSGITADSCMNLIVCDGHPRKLPVVFCEVSAVDGCIDEGDSLDSDEYTEILENAKSAQSIKPAGVSLSGLYSPSLKLSTRMPLTIVPEPPVSNGRKELRVGWFLISCGTIVGIGGLVTSIMLFDRGSDNSSMSIVAIGGGVELLLGSIKAIQGHTRAHAYRKWRKHYNRCNEVGDSRK